MAEWKRLIEAEREFLAELDRALDACESAVTPPREEQVDVPALRKELSWLTQLLKEYHQDLGVSGGEEWELEQQLHELRERLRHPEAI